MVLSGAVGELVTSKVIETLRDKHAFINVKWGSDSLRKYIHDIVIGVSAVVEFRPKSVLPFLSGDLALGVRARAKGRPRTAILGYQRFSI